MRLFEQPITAAPCRRGFNWLVYAVVLALAGIGRYGASSSEHRDHGYLYLSPLPGSEYTPTGTRFVLVRFEDVAPKDVVNLSQCVTVTASESGPHPGQTKVAGDGRTVIFDMVDSFFYDEVVTVALAPVLATGAQGRVEPFQYQFRVSGRFADSPLVAEDEARSLERMGAGDSIAAEEPTLVPRVTPTGVSVPSDFPTVEVTVNDHPALGYLFLKNIGQKSASYTMILDNDGNPLWYRRLIGRDFKVQKNGMITWQHFVGMDQDFNFVRNFSADNGYATDDHELEVLEDGGYLLIGKQGARSVDMSRYVSGGHPQASVLETVLQEFTADGELILQFRPWDHFDVGDVEPIVEDPRAASLRFPHMNAIDIDDDGHIVISSRHISEITKIDRDSGEIIWRLGGAHSDFVFVNDPLDGFRNQHDISALGTNRYLLFDNGNGHTPQVSRAVEYQLDLEARTATLVWEFRDEPDKFTYYMGNAQRLPNGNTVINFSLWGYPKIIEVDPDGVKRFEMILTPGSDLYRGFRFPWEGAVRQPYLIAEPQEDNITLVFNKFGDRDVDHYRIYGGTLPSPTKLIGISREPLAQVREVVNGVVNYFRVTAVSSSGEESDFSNEEFLAVNIVKPGENMVLNSDFAHGKDAWSWQLNIRASADWSADDGTGSCEITDGGLYLSDIVLQQPGMKIWQGRRYVLEFDAWADQPRIFGVAVRQNSPGGLDYSGIQPFTVSPLSTRYRFEFTMEEASDYDSVLALYMGASTTGLSLDNISLKAADFSAGDLNRNGTVDLLDWEIMAGEWLEDGPSVLSDLNQDGIVDFVDLQILGQQWSGGER